MSRAVFGVSAASILALLLVQPAGCSNNDTTTGSGGSKGGSGGKGGGTGGGSLTPGEVCEDPSPGSVTVRFSPAQIFVPPCTQEPCVERDVKVIVDPDFCVPSSIAFKSDHEDVVASPAADTIALHRAELHLKVKGSKVGDAKITASIAKGDGTNATAELAVHVLDPALATCSGTASMHLAGGSTITGSAGLAGASLALPAGADKPNSGSFIWSVSPFDATLACGKDTALAGYTALGPAITFGPASLAARRDLPITIPLNLARMPAAARLRHLRVAYSGPAFQKPRVIPVADARVVQVGGAWALSFQAPRLGTYQAVVATDAGTKVRKRRITYRAAIGISMGGGGTATFGFRHHDKFDVLAPLGGPVDFTWMLDYVAENTFGGFRSIAPGTQLKDIQLAATPCTSNTQCKPDETCLGASANKGKCVLLPVPKEPYVHPQTFNTWWYEYPRNGNGGTFSRFDFAQIYSDFGIMYGNPIGDNLIPGAENLPPGVPLTDKSVQGDHKNGECAVWVDPIDTDPNYAEEQAIANSCPMERCSHPLTINGFYDREFNPDGTFPVITVCDGGPQDEKLSPYADTWTPSTARPIELALAVDYNGNGVRDELEPIIREGHEPWDDFGEDQTPDSLEPGYMPGVNDDPAGDDYDAQYNPTGTENDHRHQDKEKFYDFGLDGVMGTKQQPANGWQKPGDGFDVGEGDGKFTVSRGLQRFWDRDAHSILRKMVDPKLVPGGELGDDALARVDLWTDGGTRDFFNFGVDAQHLVGAAAARGRGVGYLNSVVDAPGLDPSQGENYFYPSRIDWEDLPGVVFHRYGKSDPTQQDIDDGSGQHVGPANEITARLQSALYFIGSRWKNKLDLVTQSQRAIDNPADVSKQLPGCDEIGGSCTLDFTSKGGRKGTVGISLPPGYAEKDRTGVRYPVIYLLHGYGQKPEDLEAAIAFLSNWMNGPTDSVASRLPKAIVVYVDGRCRVQNGKPECVRGTFFADSPMKNGSQDEQWWLELMDFIDQNFRTLSEETVDWAD